MDKNGVRKEAASSQFVNKQVSNGHAGTPPQQLQTEFSTDLSGPSSLLQRMQWSYPNGHDGGNTVDGLEFMPGRAFNDPTLTSVALQDKDFSSMSGDGPRNGYLPDELVKEDRNNDVQLPVTCIGGEGTERPMSFSPCFGGACSAPTTEDLFTIPFEELTPKVPALYNFLEEGNFDNIQNVVDYSMQIGKSSTFKHHPAPNSGSSGKRKRKRK